MSDSREEQVRLAACTHLRRRPDAWLAKWGTEEGRVAWIAQDRLSASRSPAATRAAYYRLKARALEDQLMFGFECDLGLDHRVTREVLGGLSDERLSAAHCDRQDSCREYRSLDQALVDLARHPRGSA